MDLESHVVMAESVQDLHRIHEDGINLVVLPREENPAVRGFFENISKKDFNDINSFTEANQVEKLFEEHLGIYSHLKGYRKALDDLTHLSEIFQEISSESELSVNLNKIRINSTPFHIDGFKLRLVHTYIGPGTVWTPDDNVCDYPTELYTHTPPKIIDSRRIRQMKPFWVGIVKGANYTGNTCDALVHRSPRIEHLNLTRMVYLVGNINI